MIFNFNQLNCIVLISNSDMLYVDVVYSGNYVIFAKDVSDKWS